MLFVNSVFVKYHSFHTQLPLLIVTVPNLHEQLPYVSSPVCLFFRGGGGMATLCLYYSVLVGALLSLTFSNN